MKKFNIPYDIMSYSNGLLSSSTASLQRGLPGLPGIGFKLTDDGDFDIDGKRLTNLADSTDDSDAVSLKVLKEYTKDHSKNYHLQPSFTFYKYDKEGKPIESSNIDITNHNHFGQLEVVRQGVQDGFTYSNIKMTNNLSPSTYSILFEIFGYDGSKIVTDGQDDRLLFRNVEGDSNIINFDHVWFSNYAEGYLVFSNSKNVVNITLQFRYYGSSDSNFKFLFYSRCVKGVQKSGFDHRIFNLKSADFAGHILYFEPINMNNEKIMNIGNPTDDGDVVNKKYVDIENAKQDIAIADKADKSYVDGEISKVHIDTTPLLPRDGSRNMTGNLDMNSNHILSLETLTDHKVDDAYEVAVRDLKSVVNKEYLNEKFLKKDKDDNYFDLKQKTIKNSEPYYDGLFSDNDLVSKAFVDAEISKLPKPDTSDLLKTRWFT